MNGALPVARPVFHDRARVDFVLYRICLVCKLVGVALYAGGIVAAFVATTKKERHFATHWITSIAITIIWTAGSVLAAQLKVRLFELWILGGFAMTLVSKGVLVRSLYREKPLPRDMIATGISFVVAIALMVFRPTWTH